jgi:hypothetical protein
VPAKIEDVLEYFQGSKLEVYRTGIQGPEVKYMFQGLTVTVRELVSIANEDRTKRGLPPFQMVEQLH